MPAEIVGEVVGGIFRLIGRIFVEVLFELSIRGTGYMICRPFNKRVDPDGSLAAFVGIAFWIIVGVSAYVAYKHFP